MSQVGTSIINNRKGNQIVHITKHATPRHNEYTLCGILMKGKRWSTTATLANCHACMNFNALHTHAEIRPNNNVLSSND